MGLWRDFLRVLGLSGDARVHVSAPGIDVVITGEPEQVRNLLGVVKYELERSARWRDRVPQPAGAPAIAEGARRGVSLRSAGRTPQYVQPTELDEMDSPYALPDPLVMPVEDTTGERARPEARERSRLEGARAHELRDRARSESIRAAQQDARDRSKIEAHRPEGHRFVTEAATLVPDAYDSADDRGPTAAVVRAMSRVDVRPPVARAESPPSEVGNTKVDSKPPALDGDEPEREVTAIAANPSGPVHAPPGGGTAATSGSSAGGAPAIRPASPFVTDGGPTLTPPISDSELLALSTPRLTRDDHLAAELDGDETKETSRHG